MTQPRRSTMREIRSIWKIRGIPDHRTAGGYRTASSFRHGLPNLPAESRERFETLLREDARNEAITEFLPINPDTADQDLRDVLAHGPDRCAG